MNGIRVQRVLLLPLANETSVPSIEHEFREALAAELRLSRMFDVVMPSTGVDRAVSSIVRTEGRFYESELARMGRDFHVDAVIYGSVTDYRPYWPPRAGLNLTLVSTAESVPLASVDGVWDAGDQTVAAAVRSFQTELIPEPTVPASDLKLYSPKVFQRFVAHEAAEAINGRLSRSEPDADSTQHAAAGSWDSIKRTLWEFRPWNGE